MKLTAPAFDKLLHSLWIWKTKLERMLVGHSRDNLHLCTYELKRVFRSKLFLLFLSWIRKYEEFIMIQFLEMICRIASCFFFVFAWLNQKYTDITIINLIIKRHSMTLGHTWDIHFEIMAGFKIICQRNEYVSIRTFLCQWWLPIYFMILMPL